MTQVAPLALAETLAFLARTPKVLHALLEGFDPRWARVDEGPETYSAYDVVGHLIHGESTDWVTRIEHILAHGAARPFAPFDREGMRAAGAPLELDALLRSFAEKRAASLARVRALGLGPVDLARAGLHPALGSVTLGELLATWVAHDLAHLAQIARVLAKARAAEIGPWREYFRVLGGRG
jgi:hypothetical protein